MQNASMILTPFLTGVDVAEALMVMVTLATRKVCQLAAATHHNLLVTGQKDNI